MDASQVICDWFEILTPDLDEIYNDAYKREMSDWRDSQWAAVAGSGFASAAIPGVHLLGMAADINFLVNRMSVCSFGIGAIKGYKASHGNFLEKEDTACILAYWAGDENIKNAMASKVAADFAGKVGGKIGAKLIAKQLAVGAGLLVGQKLGGKAGAKIGGKIAAKMSGKALSGFIPFLGPIVSGGINAYFINDISDAAEHYYQWKCNQLSRA